MNHRLSSVLLMLILASSDAFSTVSRPTTSRDPLFARRSHKNGEPMHLRQQQRQQLHESISRIPSTALHMSATPVAGVIAGALTGGLFAGGLHAIAGESFAMVVPICSAADDGQVEQFRVARQKRRREQSQHMFIPCSNYPCLQE